MELMSYSTSEAKLLELKAENLLLKISLFVHGKFRKCLTIYLVPRKREKQKKIVTDVLVTVT